MSAIGHLRTSRFVHQILLASLALMYFSGCQSESSNPFDDYAPDAETIELIQQLNDSMINLHLLNRAILNYRVTHDMWPDSLELVKEHVPDPGYYEVLKNPVTRDDPGYAYTKPSDSADPATTVVVHQLRDGKADLTLDVLFADGEVSHGPEAIVEPFVP